MNTRLSQAISKGPISQHRSCLSSDAPDSSDLGGIGGPVRAQPSSSPYNVVRKSGQRGGPIDHGHYLAITNMRKPLLMRRHVSARPTPTNSLFYFLRIHFFTTVSGGSVVFKNITSVFTVMHRQYHSVESKTHGFKLSHTKLVYKIPL